MLLYQAKSSFHKWFNIWPRSTVYLQNKIERVLKKGGVFLFIEPPRNSIVNLARNIWYKLDKKNFESNESAIETK